MEMYKRIFVIVLDSLGIGAMPDAARFADEGADTFGQYFGENKNFEYSESSQAWVSELKVRRRYERRRVSRGALHADAGSEQRKRYDDRTLGDDGD